MTDRLEVAKTYKLFIGGAFPRSESGRSIPVVGTKGRVLAHISHASRKDLRDAVEAARKAQARWAEATASNRGQVLYRMAEMLEGKKSEFAGLIGGAAGRREVAAAIDRLVCFGGWADKYAQVLGCNNPVAGPFYNFTVPEPTGVVGVIAPDAPALLALVSLIAPPLCAGNAVVALASEANALVGAVFGEVCATSDIPGGVVNILTGLRDELVPHFASHRDIDSIHAAGLSTAQAKSIREGTADNLKRVYLHQSPERKRGTKPLAAIDWFDEDRCHSPWLIEPFVEMKTMWHPSGA
jgi:acyl-CoA reductase-like NAD-dependent aldehyde dehydrogenase